MRKFLFIGIGSIFSLFLFASSAKAVVDTPPPFQQVCIRHGHGEQKLCNWENTGFNSSGYDVYQVTSYDISGHRHGGSEIRAVICLVANAGWQGPCRVFAGTGSQLGPEYGDVSFYNPYQSGSFEVNNSPSAGGFYISYSSYVDDAEVKIAGTGRAFGADPAPVPPPVQPTDPDCAPKNQTVNVGQSASFLAGPAGASFSWSANDGSPDSGSGESFSTTYAAPDTGKTVRVTINGGATAECYVIVNPAGSPPPSPSSPAPPPPPPGPERVEICPVGSSPPCADTFFASVGNTTTFYGWYQYQSDPWVLVSTDGTGFSVCNDNPPCYGGIAVYSGTKNMIQLVTENEFGSPPSGAPVNYNSGGNGDQVGLRPIITPVTAPNPPVITGVTNASCPSTQTINWTNVANETEYKVWSNTSNPPFSFSGSTAINGWTLEATKGPNVTSHIKNTGLVAGNSYYYIITATGTAGSSASESYGPNVVQTCTSNLVNSTKYLAQVNGVTYTTNTVIRSGDTVTFGIIIANAGPSEANINYICDTPSSNFTLGTTLTVSSGETGTIGNHATCPGSKRLSFTGGPITVASNTNATVFFNSTFTSSGAGSIELCQNRGVIHYNDQEVPGAPGKTLDVNFGPTLCNKSTSGAPDFDEVAP
jgi:uncharacterized repeat protein (TIGR01451 family)